MDVLRVLIVEDNPADAALAARALAMANLSTEITVVEDADAYRRALDQPIDVVLSDYNLSGFGGVEALRILRHERLSDLPFIIVTGSIGEDEAVACMRAGADDYLLKDRLARLGEAVRHAVSANRAREKGQHVEERLRRKEIELFHAQKLEMVGRLVGGVAHDFNNLLTAMLAALELLRESAALTSQDRELLGEIEGASQRAATLTRQLLDFSRQRPIAAVNLDLNEIVSDLQFLLARLIGRQVELDLHLSPEVGLIHADRGQIEQVLMNLAANARDAMPNGGRIEISTSTDGPLQARDSVVRLSMRDSGEGIDAETQTRIFEPFFTTKAPGEGTGLGLSAVHEIVTRSGGMIEVESTPETGTAFHLLFPRVGSPPLEQKSLVYDATTRARAVVLDEDVAVRQVACRMLDRAGIRAVEARDAAEAIAITQAEPIDLLVVELDGAGLDGRALAARLMGERPSLAVVLISGDHGPDDERRARLGGLRLVQKPFSAGEFMQAAMEVLADRRGAPGGDR